MNNTDKTGGDVFYWIIALLTMMSLEKEHVLGERDRNCSRLFSIKERRIKE